VEDDFTRDNGTVEWGHEVQIGYFPQDPRACIPLGMTILDWLQSIDPTAGNEELRGLLGQMLFQREEASKPTDALSGGEVARLFFCRMMLQKPNVLVLDEPTNHLDLESINALNIALQKFEGTLFLVTHDHDLLEETATRIWRIDHNNIEDFKGTYEEYQTEMAKK
jgi:ATPase subunit of ABC transporter with duplicated ATPase domains